MNYYGYEFNTIEDAIHFGIKGMKWGVRRTPEQLGHKIPHSTRRAAAKDAKEYARAKMFYGEGAGTRRKLIIETVKQRSKDPLYKEEFERQLELQDMGKHAAKARAERTRKDTANKVKKTGRGLINAATGNIARASASAAAIYTVAHMTGLDQKIGEYASTAARDAIYWAQTSGKWAVQDFLRQVGFESIVNGHLKGER